MKKIIAFLVSIVVAYLCYITAVWFIYLAHILIVDYSLISMIAGTAIGVWATYKFVYQQLFERKEFER